MTFCMNRVKSHLTGGVNFGIYSVMALDRAVGKKTNGHPILLYGKISHYVTEFPFPNLPQHGTLNLAACLQNCIRFNVHLPRPAETGQLQHHFKYFSKRNGDGEQTLTMSCHLCRSFLHYGIHYGLPLQAIYAAYDFHHVHSGICDTCQRPFLSKGTCIVVPVCLYCHVHTWTGLIRS